MGKVKHNTLELYDNNGNPVSIPYGKGKGSFERNLHHICNVSIPYGKGKDKSAQRVPHSKRST